MDFLIEYYNPYGFAMLLISASLWSLSHFTFVKRLNFFDFFLRITGFVTFATIFLLSGWKAGLMAIPVIIGASIIGAGLAKVFFIRGTQIKNNSMKNNT